MLTLLPFEISSKFLISIALFLLISFSRSVTILIELILPLT
jgi:hypothetical protein